MAHESGEEFRVESELDPSVAILKIFPAISEEVVRGAISSPKLKGIVLETYGSGNTMKFDWFIDCLEEEIKKGKIILNVSQCIGGEVEQGRYATSKKLNEIGVLSGGDITTEAALTKMMFLLGSEPNIEVLKSKLTLSLAGEMD
ncbi:MAG: hypothetical protein AB8B73_08220 [Ekhidna sp.]